MGFDSCTCSWQLLFPSFIWQLLMPKTTKHQKLTFQTWFRVVVLVLLVGPKCFLYFVVVCAARVLVFVKLRRSAQLHGMIPPADPLSPRVRVCLTTKTRRPPVLSMVLHFLRRAATSSSASESRRIWDMGASVMPPLMQSCFSKKKVGTHMTTDTIALVNVC